MQKAKKILIFLIIAICISLNVNAVDIEDEYEELDYVWLHEEIENAKKDEKPTIYSKYCVVFDRASKTVIFGKDEEEEVPMASTTKIITAIVLLENVNNLNEEVEVCKQAASIGGSRLGLKMGDKITYNDLLYGLMLCSGNDAAVQIAVSVSGSIEEFAKLMNQKVKKLGLVHSHFVVPHGLDNVGHYTTAKELAIITDYALNIKKFQDVVSTKTYTITINEHSKTINNTNELLGYLNGVNGVKTGFTNGAGRCLVTSVLRNNFNIITVVLGADTKKIRTQDSIKLIEYTYKNYELVNLEEIVNREFANWEKINKKRIRINKGIFEESELMLDKLKFTKYPVLKEQNDNIYVDIDAICKIEAPVKEKTKIGKAKIFLNSTEIASVDILIKEKIERKNYIDYFRELLQLYKLLFIGKKMVTNSNLLN